MNPPSRKSMEEIKCKRCNKRERIIRSLYVKMEALKGFVEQADHLNGCIRRHSAYPLSRSQEPCDCGKANLMK